MKRPEYGLADAPLLLVESFGHLTSEPWYDSHQGGSALLCLPYRNKDDNQDRDYDDEDNATDDDESNCYIDDDDDDDADEDYDGLGWRRKRWSTRLPVRNEDGWITRRLRLKQTISTVEGWFRF